MPPSNQERPTFDEEFRFGQKTFHFMTRAGRPDVINLADRKPAVVV